jgi:branched-chain amino acid aminotransferase
LNERGLVAECATSNLFAVRGGQLLTPPLAAGALGGITRGVVLEIAGALKLPCAEWDLAPENLLASDELFLTNAGMGIMPLVMLDGHPIGQGAAGTVTARVQKAYNELFACETESCE